MQELIRDTLILCSTHGIYVDDIHKDRKIIKISVPSESCQMLKGEDLALEFKTRFTRIFPGYRILAQFRDEYWSTDKCEHFFNDNINIIYDELDTIFKKQGR